MPNLHQDERFTLATLTNIIGASAMPLLHALFAWKSDKSAAIESVPWALGTAMVLLASAACGDWLEKRFHLFAMFVEIGNTPVSESRNQSLEGIVVLLVVLPIGYVIAAAATGGTIWTLGLGVPLLLFLGAWFNWERSREKRRR